MPVQPVILSAGNSQRMGFPKALLPLETSTFLGRILGTVASCFDCEPIVVLGRHAEWIRPAIPAGIQVCINPDPDRGQLSSLLLAIDAIPDASTGCLVWPVDQPLVPRTTIEGIVRLFESSNAAISLPVCCGRRGHPGIFHRRLFPELRELGPCGNPKPVILRHAADTMLFQTDSKATIIDIDTPEDYQEWTGNSLESALKKRGYQFPAEY